MFGGSADLRLCWLKHRQIPPLEQAAHGSAMRRVIGYPKHLRRFDTMHRFALPVIAVILALVALSGPAIAQQRGSEQLIRSVERELPNYVDGVDVRSLTVGQVSSLHVILHSGRRHSAIRGQVIAILGGLDELMFGRNFGAL